MSGIHVLVGAHAFAGEMGALCFLWALVEVINRSEASLARARVAAILGVILLFLAIVFAAYPYVTYYGAVEKPIIKAGHMSWAHDIFTEAKEHIAILIPIVGLVATLAMFAAKAEGPNSPAYHNIALLCGLVVVMGFVMAGMGFVISTVIRLSVPGGV